MARPTKCRRICHMPLVQEFMPTGQIEDEPIILNLDEYEAIRLMDREGMSQQECSISTVKRHPKNIKVASTKKLFSSGIKNTEYPSNAANPAKNTSFRLKFSRFSIG